MPASIRETRFENVSDPSATEWRRQTTAARTSAAASERSRAEAAREAARRAGLRRYRAWIVTDCSTFTPPFTAGGTERQLSDLADQLELCGTEVTIVVREVPLRHAGPRAARAVRTRYIPPAPVPKGLGWAALGPNLRYIAATFRYLLRARHEYDVLIVSGFRQLAFPMALLGRLIRKPCVLRIDSSWDLDDELTPESNARIGHRAKRIASAAIRASRRAAFQFANAVLAFSDPLERRLIELGAPARKVKQIPNGLDTARFAPVGSEEKRALRRALGLPLDRAIFIYTGRIIRAKGLLELMRAWESLAGRADLFLMLVGSGAHTHESCEPELRAFIARHQDSVGWRGAVDNVAEYLQASDVFISLSYFESFGLSMVEAVSTGLPCIVSDVGCARQVVRHGESGAILPPRAAPESVLTEIERMLVHRDRWPAMGALGRARVVDAFDLQAVARRYVGLFETLGARGRPQPRP